MLKNYLKVAFRNLLKQRFYSMINIIGLSVGLMSCLLITLLVIDDLNYDTFNEKGDRIFRVDAYYKMGGQEEHVALTPGPMASTLHKTYPEVEHAVRFRERGEFTVQRGENLYRESRIVFADSTLLDVFSIPLLYGEPSTVLSHPNAMMISAATARKYFGNNWESDPPIGETLWVGRDKVAYQITGIFDKIPNNAHFHFDLFLSLASLEESRTDLWVNYNFHTYLLLKEGADRNTVEQKLANTFATYAAPQIKRFTGNSIADFRASGNAFEYTLTPLNRIHLYSHLEGEFESNGDIKYVWIFSAIAFFVLVIACVNFMNLSTARSAGRAREVGVRKAMGSDRQQLIKQFLTEAVLISFFSLAIAVILAELLLPYFNELSGKQLSIGYIENWYFLPVLVVATLVVGLLAGSYPAFFLSAFRPASVLKGTLASGMKNSMIRNSLVVIQFVISISLIVSTLIVYQQLNHIQRMKLGYNKDHVLVVQNTYSLRNQTSAFKTEALRHPGVLSATVSGYLPAKTVSSSKRSIFPDKDPNSAELTSLTWWYVDDDYLQTMGMEIVKGRNFSPDYGTDSLAMIVNESAYRHFGLEQTPNQGIGAALSTFGDNPDEITSYKVIGVVKDFHYTNMHQKIRPMVLVLGRNTAAISFRMTGNNIPQTISQLEETWKKFVPDLPFEYSFMDDRFDSLYQSEQKVGRIFTVCCMLAILIACLGLFGLATYTAEQRTKEIGIRKVMGASVWSVIVMFSKDFTKLVIISIVVAAPISYLAMQAWLEDFAYRISIGPGVFILAGAVALLLSWITVSFQSFKAAVNDPVESLRNE